MRNLATKVFVGDGTFTVPGRVKRVRVRAIDTTLYKNRLIGVVSNDGTTYMWGEGASGLLGDGTSTSKSSPVAVSGSHSFVSTYDNGNDCRWGIDSNGVLWGWGINLGSNPPIGDGTLTSRTTPVRVLGGRFTRQFSTPVGAQTAAQICTDGNTYMWGLNTSGQIGNNAGGTLIAYSSPVLVSGGHNFVKIIQQGTATYGIDSAGAAWAWGSNQKGQLGNGASVSQSTPVAVSGGHIFQDISPGNNGSALGLDTDGNLWAWGSNGFGELGDGTTVAKSTPVAVAAGTKFSKVVHATNADFFMAIDTSGNLWSWGRNANGALGQNLSPAVTLAKSSPVMISAGMGSIIQVKGSSTTIGAVNSSGTMYMWGQNIKGLLGTGQDPVTVVATSSPVAVSGGHVFTDFEFGASSVGQMTASDTNGKLWCWGRNDDGQLGDGTVVSKSTPVAVLGQIPLNLLQPQNSVEVDVTPGQSYAVVISEYQARFGTTTFLGQLFDRVIVEYEE